MSSEIIYDMDARDLADQIVGKTVTSIDTAKRTLTLSDGTLLKVEDTSDCCAWFDATLREGKLTQNAVTAVTATARDDDDYCEHYTLHVLAVDDEVCAVEIDGTEGNGYYCHSINLEVVKPEEEA